MTTQKIQLLNKGFRSKCLALTVGPSLDIVGAYGPLLLALPVHEVAALVVGPGGLALVLLQLRHGGADDLLDLLPHSHLLIVLPAQGRLVHPVCLDTELAAESSLVVWGGRARYNQVTPWTCQC